MQKKLGVRLMSSVAAAAASKQKFRVPRRTHLKYEPVVYDRMQFLKYQRPVELDRRQQMLQQQYMDFMARPALLFIHGCNLEVMEVQRMRMAFQRSQIGFTYVNARLFKSALHGSKYEPVQALLNGPTYCAYPMPNYLGTCSPDVLEVPEEIRPCDTPSFLRDFMRISLPFKNLIVMGGQIEGALYGPTELKSYSQLLGREALLGELLGTISHPSQNLTAILERTPSELSYIISHVHPSSSTADAAALATDRNNTE